MRKYLSKNTPPFLTIQTINNRSFKKPFNILIYNNLKQARITNTIFFTYTNI